MELVNENKWKRIHSPVILTGEELTHAVKNSDYIFKNQLQKLEKITKNIADNGTERLKRNGNIIGLAGERGSGKTSILGTFKNLMSLDDRFYTFNIIEPEHFDSEISIVIFYLTSLYNLIRDERELLVESHQFIKIIYDLERAVEVLKESYQKTGIFDKDIVSMDILDEVSFRLDFSTYIGKLTKTVISTLNGTEKYRNLTNFILIIDDVDLCSNSQIYQLFSEVNQYLAESITVILSYRESQLLMSIVDEIIKDNQTFLNEFISKDDISEQAKNIISKSIPIQNKVIMPEIMNLQRKNITALFGDSNQVEIIPDILQGEKSENVSIIDLIFKEIFNRTTLDIKPIDKNEDYSNFFPKNLRGLLQFLEFIDCSLKTGDNLTKEELIYCYQENLFTFSDYVLAKVDTELNDTHISFIKNWLNTPNSLRNFMGHKFFHSQLREFFSNNSLYEVSDSIKYNTIIKKEAHNISIGDLVEILEDFKMYMSEDGLTLYLAYIFKVIYSLQLAITANQLLLDYNDDELLTNSIAFDDYLELVNGTILPEDFNFYSYSTEYKEAYILYLEGLLSFKYDDNVERDEESIQKIHFLMYSGLTSTSEISKNIKEPKSNLRYRRYFTNDFVNNPPKNIRSSSKFRIHPYAFFSHKQYVSIALKSQLAGENSSEKKYLLFTNLFTADYFIRKTYHRRSAPPIEYALERMTKALFHEFSKTDPAADKAASSLTEQHNVKDFTDCIINSKNTNSPVSCIVGRTEYFVPYDDTFIDSISHYLLHGEESNTRREHISIKLITDEFTEKVATIKNKQELIEYLSDFNNRKLDPVFSEVIKKQISHLSKNRTRITNQIRNELTESFSESISRVINNE